MNEPVTNRLAFETSPYLLLHAHNPVDWYAWGEEALGRARELGRPIFLSVGYSTCYWCHVMERESFSDATTAELMNRSFVNVKLDREERPDLDEVYMTATQILTGHGGWPNSVFLTPDLKPFYAGTYFPPEDRYGRPGFRSLLRGLARAWEGSRSEVEEQAEEVATTMRRYLEERGQAGSAPPPASVRDAAVSGLARRFDGEYGGFGGAPKFPTPSNLFLLHEVAGAAAEKVPGTGSEAASEGSRKVPGTADREAAGMLAATLDQMARGGLYDQLGGGFHRYATDRAWRVPHFEKMLYDNALLLELYARHHARTGDAEARRVAAETAAFLEREMTLPDGGLASAIDAETDGREGAYYVWSRDELEQTLGAEDFAFLAPIYGFEGPPFFADDSFVLHLPVPLDEQARRRRRDRDDLLAEIEPLRQRLFAARSERPRPLTDDKVLTDWNGMAIAALATAGRLLGEPGWVRRAARAADFVLATLRPAGRLLHAWRGGAAHGGRAAHGGPAKVPGMLADYAWMVRGLLALAAAEAETDGESAGRRLAAAGELAAEQRTHLGDPAGGYFNAEARPDLLLRSKEVLDGAIPAANAVAALNALDLAAATGDETWLADARGTLAAAAPLVEQFPDGARMMTLAAGRWHERAGSAAVRGGEAAGPSAAGGGALAAEAEAVVTAELEVGEAAEEGSADVESQHGAGWRPFRLRLRVADGWHVQAHRVGDDALVATKLAAAAAQLRQVEYPPGETFATGGAATSVYRGEVEIRGAVRPRGTTAALLLTYQPCDDRRCLPPVERRIGLTERPGGSSG